MLNTMSHGSYSDSKIMEITRGMKRCDVSALATAGHQMARVLLKQFGKYVRRTRCIDRGVNKQDLPKYAYADVPAELGECKVILVPIPGRSGVSVYTDILAKIIGDEVGIEVKNILTGTARESFCAIKRKKGKVKDPRSFFGFKVAQEHIDEETVIIFIDNIIDTGTTLETALSMFPDQECLSLVYSHTDRYGESYDT